MAADIMVDVRDMTCAQALVQADRAMRKTAVGSTLEILCNAPDVREDLLVWARELGYVVLAVDAQAGDISLKIRRTR
ncbi:MAG: sulfurtransferase TusA family protein [Candidatus Omnitrophica bacterium]|nr:sulfurtransferase TusA family protein [Candidatus Omnitrophota bacterium]